MRVLNKKKKRFLQSLDKYESIYKFNNKEEYLIISNGILNFIWNVWCNFWRDYWLSHINGGYYFDHSKLNKLKRYNDKQAIHYLCHLAGKFSSHSPGQSIIGNHLEITWGDYNKIEDIALKLLVIDPSLTHLNYLLGIIPNYKIEINHFQQIRNSFIHLNNENIKKLDIIKPYYIFNNNQDAIEILESNHLNSGDICFFHLTNHLRGLVMNL